MTSLVDRYEAFAIDLDGVVWRGEEMLGGAAGAIAAVRKAGKRLLLLSNNAAYSPKTVAARLAAAGIEIAEGEVLTSLVVARAWIRAKGLAGSPAFVMGPPEVEASLDDLVRRVPVERDADPALVLVARDIRFDFRRLTAAADAVRAGAAFAAVNRDATMPAHGRLDPGTGSILAAIEAASGRSATVLGKPEAPMMEAAVERLGRTDVLMVGDRLESDIAGARRVGWDAALVLSGVTRAGDVLDPAPDFVLEGLGALAGAADPLPAYQPRG